MSRLQNAWHLSRPTAPLVPAPVDPAEDLADEPLAAPEPQPGRININSASKSALTSLPGIGPASADSIIKTRPHASLEGMIETADLWRLDETDLAAIAELVTF